ncbi:MAG: LemA family protein [Saprospiraceae bacterium]|nr:LemA family protein [Saprospiraceae bacterium]MBK6564912.1 LemA family protein [Saprospiraceae bacterium]MBK6783058.1 LemA family protein [Saprospiraceae bacterium]MBK7523553.1 LemA family protein [Saprospiraceae bacterium]MBK8079668.1 LemA family protein [Saprospiraceae bacterium]
MLYILIFLVLVGLFFMGAYNKLVSLKNKVMESWSGIDVQLKRRHDLIPNLVNTVKGYAAHESGTLEKVIQARNMAMTAGNTGNINQQVQAENALSGTLKSLFALSENYPDLKANTNFLSLQGTLSEIEESLANARRYYNALVRDNNTYVESFPSNLIANAFQFGKFEFFELENDAERANPEVKF